MVTFFSSNIFRVVVDFRTRLHIVSGNSRAAELYLDTCAGALSMTFSLLSVPIQAINLSVIHLSDKVMRDSSNCGNEEISPAVNQIVVSVMQPNADSVS